MRRPLALACLCLLVLTGCGKNDPNSASAKEARTKATQAVEAYGPAAWDLGEPLASAKKDVCQQGQQNWKVKEIDYGCAVGHSWILPGVDTEAEVADELVRMQGIAEKLGCTGDGKSDLTMAQKYWNEKTTTDPARLPGARLECADGVWLELDPRGPGDPYFTPISTVGSLTGGDVATPVFQEFPDDTKSLIQGTSQAMLWQITATKTYAEKK